MDIKKLIKNNEAWVNEKLKCDKEYFSRMANDQSPEILYIGCSDSRVMPEKFTGVESGGLFVHRNIANQVMPGDANADAVIQFAVEVLKVKHIIICGHYGCGGANAALNPQDLGKLNFWISGLDKVHKLYDKELLAITDATQKANRFVELNVIEQAKNLSKVDHVMKYKPSIHGWVYDISTGKIIDLELRLD